MNLFTQRPRAICSQRIGLPHVCLKSVWPDRIRDTEAPPGDQMRTMMSPISHSPRGQSRGFRQKYPPNGLCLFCNKRAAQQTKELSHCCSVFLKADIQISCSKCYDLLRIHVFVDGFQVRYSCILLINRSNFIQNKNKMTRFISHKRPCQVKKIKKSEKNLKVCFFVHV